MVEQVRHQVGSAAWCARHIRSTLHDSRDLVVSALDVAAALPAGAKRTELREFALRQNHAEFLCAVVMQSKEEMERLLRAAADLALGIVAVFESGPRPMSAMVLARSLGEAVLRFCYIHDPNVGPERTLLRMAAHQVESVEDNLRTAEAFGKHGIGDAKEARANIATMHQYYTKHGFTRAPAKRPEFTANLGLGGHKENLSFNATDAYKRFLPVGYWDWAIGSGATHGRAWFLPNVVGTSDEAPFADADEIARTVTLQLLELATALANVLHGHAGVDVEEFQRKVHSRRLGVSGADGTANGQAVHHRDYGRRQVEPTFPNGGTGASFTSG